MNKLEETLRAVQNQKAVYRSNMRAAKTEEEFDYWMSKVKALGIEEEELLAQLKVER